MEAEISLDGHEYKGVVTGISPEVRSGQVTGRVKFAGEQPPSLRQSQRGSVRIVIEQRAKALKFERSSDIVSGTKAVYVVDGDQAVLTAGRARRRLGRRDRSAERPQAGAGSRHLRHRRHERRSRIPHQRLTAGPIYDPGATSQCSK
jgi:hypothetical protein